MAVLEHGFLQVTTIQVLRLIQPYPPDHAYYIRREIVQMIHKHMKWIILSSIIGLLLVIFHHAVGRTHWNSLAQDNRAGRWITPVIEAPRLQREVFYSAAAKTKISYHIYTPELYDTKVDRRFPVLYWLHGRGGNVARLSHIARHFDRAIRARKMPPVLVVFPYSMATGMWCNSKDGKTPIETVVVKEVVPHVDADYRTIASPTARLVEGFSMGGYGAARLGFKHHEIFGAISILGAGPLQQEFSAAVGPKTMASIRKNILYTVYGDDQEYFKAQSPWVLAEQHADALRDRTVVRLVVGARDDMLTPNQHFSRHLKNLKIPHSFQVMPNVGHNPLAVFKEMGETNWDFYRGIFGTKTSMQNMGGVVNGERSTTGDQQSWGAAVNPFLVEPSNADDSGPAVNQLRTEDPISRSPATSVRS